MIARAFLGTLAALALVDAVTRGHVAFAWWIAAGVGAAAALEAVVGVVRRRLTRPSAAPRRTP